MPEPLPTGFFARPVVEVARDLVGCTFLCDGVGGRLVEVEAYRADDAASHSYRGRTPRNAVMFGPPGRLYVYFTMGLHFCCNLVCEPEGQGAGVLLRALEPASGLERMIARRRLRRPDPRQLCSGPGKLTQALSITLAHNGLPADRPPFAVLPRAAGEAPPRVVVTPRIGVSAATGTPWRFVDADSAFLSRRLPARPRS